MERQERQKQKRQEKESRRGNRQIMILTYGVVAVFLAMAGYLASFTAIDSEEIINNSRNKRQELLAERVIKGKILSADGEVLAETVTDADGKEYRNYPEKKVFCHVVGRSSNSLTGIELSQCYPLLTSHSNPIKQLGNTLRGEKNQGDTVITTLDAKLQRAAYQALGDHRGAIVALEPSTGKVLAMVSKPAYDPNTVLEQWEELVKDSDEESALVNRATQGLYPPGSTFKMVTAMEYLIENPKDYSSFHYTCKGTDIFSGSRINCYNRERHGSLNLTASFAESCNGSFAKIGTMLNVDSYRSLCEKLYFNRKLPVGFEANASKFVLDKTSDVAEITQTAMGQGRTVVTPLQNAMITAMIANGGEMMTPYVVDHTENESGKLVKQYEPHSLGKKVDEWVAEKTVKLMKAVVNQGTGTMLKGLPYQAAGKTGSAEFDSEGTSHAWFVGFAPAKDPQIVVSIVVEGAGTGSQYAVPIAKKMFQEYVE